MSRAVMQQALEALEAHAEMGLSATSVIIELRAALAEPEPEPDMRHQKIQALLAKSARSSIEIGIMESLLFVPKYEPSFPDSEYWLPIHDEIVRLKDATPPQRKPLTDKQIEALFKRVSGYQMFPQSAVAYKFARAVERAHGIGGEE